MLGVFWTAAGNFLIYYLWMHSLFPPKDICTSNYLSSIQFQLGGWAWARCGMCVEMRCVEWTCSEVFQKPFLICMSGSVYKMENVILVFSLICFHSVVNTLENGMGSAGPQHVCVGGLCSFFLWDSEQIFELQCADLIHWIWDPWSLSKLFQIVDMWFAFH